MSRVVIRRGPKPSVAPTYEEPPRGTEEPCEAEMRLLGTRTRRTPAIIENETPDGRFDIRIDEGLVSSMRDANRAVEVIAGSDFLRRMMQIIEHANGEREDIPIPRVRRTRRPG